MKKVLDIFVLLFLFASHSWAIDYRAFYTEANKLEIYIVEGEYEKAFRVYSSAFKKWLRLPAVDVYNALLCAVKEGKHKVAIKYSKVLMERGWSLDFFSKNPYLEVLRDDPRWTSLVDSYPAINASYCESVDSTLFRELQAMEDRDQYLVKSPDYGSYLRAVVYHANKMDAMSREKRTENLLWRGSETIYYSPFPSVIIRHYLGLYNEIERGYQDSLSIVNDTLHLVDLRSSLLEEIKKGSLCPLVYDFTSTYSGDLNKFGGGIFFKVGKTVLRKNLTKEEEARIDANRKSIGQGLWPTIGARWLL